MKAISWSTAILLSFAVTACGGSDGDDTSSSLTIDNSSSYILLEINLSPIDQETWGPDLLGNDTLDPGDHLVLTDIACDVYDIRVLDDTSTECILHDVDLCADSAVWQIDDTELALCGF